MTDLSKIKPAHTAARRLCLRAPIDRPRKSNTTGSRTERQYALVDRAVELGWPREQVTVVDEDLGLSGSGTDKRSGFARLIAAVAMRLVGIVLGLEVSRLARNNADWYHLLDLCAMTDTLIGDADGLYHPAWFNDRLLLGLKGTMSEAELHIIRARLEGGIRNKAARGELRRGLPTGFVWGEEEGQVLLHPDEAVTAAYAVSLSALPSSGRFAVSGCGCAPKAYRFPRSTTTATKSAGAPRPTRPFTASSPAPFMPAPTSTARVATNGSSTRRVKLSGVAGSCPRRNGRF